jgi:hypothetical protein
MNNEAHSTLFLCNFTLTRALVEYECNGKYTMDVQVLGADGKSKRIGVVTCGTTQQSYARNSKHRVK